jgi:hypothetical protein
MHPRSNCTWFVEPNGLREQDRVALVSEQRLEDWIAADLSLLGEDLLLIDRQTRTTGDPLDILASPEFDIRV